MSNYTNTPNQAEYAAEQELNQESYNSELYIIETGERLEMVQAAVEPIDLSCCGDS